MKKLMMMVAVGAAIATMTGCTSSTRIEWGGKSAVRNPDGSVITAADGAPYYESEKNIYEDSNWLTKREERDVKVDVQANGAYTASLGSRVNDVSSNGVAIVTGGINELTKLVDTAADAYVKIAGGGAQADTALSMASKVINYFASKGGDVAKATVTTDTASNTLKVSDGTTCVECDAQGNCTDCTVSPSSTR